MAVVIPVVPHLLHSYFLGIFSLPVLARSHKARIISMLLLTAIPEVCLIDEDSKGGVFRIPLP